MTQKAGRWNHNIHYHSVILNAVPAGARLALDIGCGEGMLARQLQQRIPDVTGIDLDEASIGLAETRNSEGVHFLRGDFVTYPFEPESFDFVVSVATLHHLDAISALSRVRELLRPGGVLCIIGLASGRLPRDLPIELAAAVVHRFHSRTKGWWQHPSPTLPTPPETYGDMRRIAIELLPGASFRRRLLWRYSLTWTKPSP